MPSFVPIPEMELCGRRLRFLLANGVNEPLRPSVPKAGGVDEPRTGCERRRWNGENNGHNA